MKEAYPLCWPSGYQRTLQRINSRFKSSMDAAQRFLRMEIKRLDGDGLIVSTNLRIRNDGGLYADDLKKKIDDPGVAIYFKRKKKDISLCCDQYATVWENIYALGKGIEAMRGLERWGVSDFLDRAFTGFAALPESIAMSYWWMVLGIDRNADKETITNAWRQLVKLHHPDRGGDATKFQEIQKAYEEAMEQLK